MFSIIFLVFQSATIQSAAITTEAAVQQESPAAAGPAEAPAPKRVCKTVLDNRTGMIAQKRKICRTVRDGEDANAN